MKKLITIILLSLILIFTAQANNLVEAHGEEEEGNHLITQCVEEVEIEHTIDKSRRVKYFAVEGNYYYYNTIPNIVKEIEILEVLVPCVVHTASYLYPSYIIPSWSGIRVKEGNKNIQIINGSYTIDLHGLIKFNQPINEPIWYSMRVHKNGSVMFNGPLTLNSEEQTVVFNNQVVGVLINGFIIWIHEIRYP